MFTLVVLCPSSIAPASTPCEKSYSVAGVSVPVSSFFDPQETGFRVSKAHKSHYEGGIVPPFMKQILWHPGSHNLDLGNGASSATDLYLDDQGVTNHSVDPIQRDNKENAAHLTYLKSRPADTATVHVLPDIKEDDARKEVIRGVSGRVKMGGAIYFNCKTVAAAKKILPEVQEHYPNVKVRGSVIVASNHKIPVVSL